MRPVRRSGWGKQIPAFLVLLGAGAGLLIARTTSAAAGDASSVNVFAEVPAGMFLHATPSSTSCSLDVVNLNAAQGAAIDHIGLASFDGWVGDAATGKVPARISLVLDGVQDFHVQASTGGNRPDVAAARHNPAFMLSGFHVDAYLAGVPVGDYQVMLYYQIKGKTMVCPTNDTVSVQ